MPTIHSTAPHTATDQHSGQLQYKELRAHGFKVLDEAQGVVEAIVAVYGNVDSAEERILYGAFKQSLTAKYPKGVWMHDWSKPVAKTLEARELPPGDPRLPPELKAYGGLYIKGQFNLGTQRGKDAFSDIAFGIIDEFSIGYKIIQSRYSADDSCLDLIELQLYEWSPVLVGCNPITQLISAKTMATTTVQTKGEMLGEFVEADICLSALQAAYNGLWWYIWHVMADTDEDDLPWPQRRAIVAKAFDEFRDLSLSVVDAIMAGEADETYEESMKWLAAQGIASKSKDDVKAKGLPPAGLPLHQHSQQVLAAIEGYTKRLHSIRELNVKAGRALSQARQDRIKEHAGTCKETSDKLFVVYEDLIGMLEEANPAEGNGKSAQQPEPTQQPVDAEYQRKVQQAITRFKINHLNLQA